ncbi:MAG: DUF1365 domain-containing protein [Mariniblastus sp.]
MPSSCIYEGLIRHRRNDPVHHEFFFRSFLLMIDLEEVETVFDRFWLWSTKRFAFARFQPNDHLKKHLPIADLRSRVTEVLNENDFRQPVGPVKILTQLTYVGFAMNPVSFFYCYDPTGERLVAVIAEVNNTPWGEQHVYFLPTADAAESESSGAKSSGAKSDGLCLDDSISSGLDSSDIEPTRSESELPQSSGIQKRNTPQKPSTLFADYVDKTFHVSPFMSLDMHYRMAFSSPGEKLALKIENHRVDPNQQRSKRLLDVSMTMKRKALTSTNLNWMLIKYPLISFKIFAGIYWQALRLYLKKVPFISHPHKLSHPTSNPDVDPTAEGVNTKSISAKHASLSKNASSSSSDQFDHAPSDQQTKLPPDSNSNDKILVTR